MSDGLTPFAWLNYYLAEAAKADQPALALAQSIEQMVNDGRLVHYHFPTRPKSRYGWGRPPHPLFQAKLEKDLPAIQRRLGLYAGMSALLAGVRRDAPTPDNGEAYWAYPLLPVIDAISICGMISEFGPTQFIEIGMGQSTRFARLAIDAYAPLCRLTSIDGYYPYDAVKSLPDVHIGQSLENADLGIFKTLKAGDVVWLDGSHHAYSGTDAAVFCFDVLPILAPGVVIGVHDITLPWDYPEGWNNYYFNEIFALGSFLLGALDRVEFLFPALYINHIDQSLREKLAPLWKLPELTSPMEELAGGGGFWFRSCR